MFQLQQKWWFKILQKLKIQLWMLLSSGKEARSNQWWTKSHKKEKVGIAVNSCIQLADMWVGIWGHLASSWPITWPQKHEWIQLTPQRVERSHPSWALLKLPTHRIISGSRGAVLPTALTTLGPDADHEIMDFALDAVTKWSLRNLGRESI